jgi:gliding motility-associated-like protein
MKKNDIEDIFKDSFKDFEAEVSPGVWSNIQTALKGVGIGLLGKAILNKIGTNTIIAIVSSAAAVISTVVIMNWGGKNTKQVAVTKPAAKVIEKPKLAQPEEIREFLSEDNKKTVTTRKPELKKEETKTAESSKSAVIRKDKMKEVISEYSNLPVASISASPVGGTVPLVVNISNAGTGKINKWNFGDNKKESGNNPLHVYDTPGIYTITLASTGEDGKTAYDSIKVEVYGNSSILSAPKEFTPNGDGNHDILRFNTQNISSMNVTVFDKNGTIFYRSESLDAKWDGTDLKGQKAKDDVYFFIQTATGVDGKKYEQKGAINLKR